MSKLYKANFLGYLQTEDEYSMIHIFAFNVKMLEGQNYYETLFSVVDEVNFFSSPHEDYDEEYFKICYQFAILANSKNVNFDKLKGKECLVELKDLKVINIFPMKSTYKGGQNGK